MKFERFVSHVQPEIVDFVSTSHFDRPAPLRKNRKYPGFDNNQIQRLAEISVQKTAVYAVQFSLKKSVVRFDFSASINGETLSGGQE
jgi:hypothetical protein